MNQIKPASHKEQNNKLILVLLYNDAVTKEILLLPPPKENLNECLPQESPSRDTDPVSITPHSRYYPLSTPDLMFSSIHPSS